MSRTVIEEDLSIDGNVRSEEGDILVKGRITGDVTARTVEINPGGEVTGAITADAVTIHGRQSGRIKCDELALQKDAEVKADVVAKTMSSEKGARLVGKVQITS